MKIFTRWYCTLRVARTVKYKYYILYEFYGPNFLFLLFYCFAIRVARLSHPLYHSVSFKISPVDVALHRNQTHAVRVFVSIAGFEWNTFIFKYGTIRYIRLRRREDGRERFFLLLTYVREFIISVSQFHIRTFLHTVFIVIPKLRRIFKNRVFVRSFRVFKKKKQKAIWQRHSCLLSLNSFRFIFFFCFISFRLSHVRMCVWVL